MEPLQYYALAAAVSGTVVAYGIYWALHKWYWVQDNVLLIGTNPNTNATEVRSKRVEEDWTTWEYQGDEEGPDVVLDPKYAIEMPNGKYAYHVNTETGEIYKPETPTSSDVINGHQLRVHRKDRELEKLAIATRLNLEEYIEYILWGVGILIVLVGTIIYLVAK